MKTIQGEEPTLVAHYWRNDYMGIEQYSTSIGAPADLKLQREHAEFARMWDRNQRDQGFLEAFEQQHRQT